MKRIIGKELSKRLAKMWGLNEEGEVHGNARELGLPGLWHLSGTHYLNARIAILSLMLSFQGGLGYTRIFSKYAALRKFFCIRHSGLANSPRIAVEIKARLSGVYTSSYSSALVY